MAMLGAVLASAAAAQGVGTIRGTVREGTGGRGIADAQVMVLGTTQGAVTNANGEYVITSVPGGAVKLRARRIGFGAQTLSVTVTGAARADFQLFLSPTDLSAVVVTGTAGPVERRTVGNSITELDVGRLTEQSSLSNVTDVLQSKTPGLTLIPGSGAPGTAADIRIRGTSSISASNRPIFYIDGVRFNDGPLGSYGPSGSGITGNAFSQGTSALDAINPEDIERIEVIKGPAASTLYGSDAAGGVIQIFTKRGLHSGKPQWTLKNEYGNTNWALERPTNYTTCTQARIDQKQTDGTFTWPGCHDPGVVAGTVLTDNPLTRNREALRTGHYQNTNLSIRGGSDKYTYFVSGDRSLDLGVLRNSFNNRRSVRGNFGLILSPKMDIALNASYLNTQNRLPLSDDAGGGLIISAIRGMPGRFVNQAYGFALNSPQNANAYDNQTKVDRTLFGTTVNYHPWSWLSNRLTLGMDVNSPLAQVFYPVGSADFPSGFIAQTTPITHLYTFDYTGTVMNDFRKLSSKLSVGIQGNKSNTRRVEATGSGFPSPDFLSIGASATTVSGASSYSEQAGLGYFVQEQVGYANRVFVTAAVRADDNSAFGQNFSKIYYPKAALSWVISEEPRFSRLFSRLHTDNFKFRFAYGQAGHAPGPYDAIRTYTGSKVINGNNSASSALIPSAPGNAGLHAERGVETEGGFDASFLDGRVSLEFTTYRKTTRDALLLIPNAPSLGFTNSRYVNFGSLKNTGNELGLTVRPIDRPNFAWDAHLNYSHNTNVLTQLKYLGLSSIEVFDPYLVGNAQRILEGYPVAGWWALDAKRNPDNTFLLDAAGKLQLDTLKYLGPSTPPREGSFSSTFTILKNLRLYGLIDFKGGNFLLNQKERNRVQVQLNGESINNGSMTSIDSAYYRNTSITKPWIQPADFVKLRDVSVGYTLPKAFASQLRVERATVTLSGHNLAILSKKYGGIDPEVSFIGNSTFLSGSSNFLQFLRVDSYTLPMLRRYTASLTLNF